MVKFRTSKNIAVKSQKQDPFRPKQIPALWFKTCCL